MSIIKRTIVVFANEMNSLLINELNKHSQYSIVSIFSGNDFRTIQDNCYDAVIIMDNQAISESYVFTVAKFFLTKKKEIISLYRFKKHYYDILNNIASENNVIASLYIVEQKEREYLEYNIPIIYITGISKNTQQIFTHIMFNTYFRNIGMKVTNVSNSRLSNLLGYIDIKNEMNLSLLDYKRAIYNINTNIYKEVENNKSEIIIISDEMGYMPYDRDNINDFGFYNNVIKYALPPDYVVCNVFLSEYTNESLSLLYKSILEETKTNEVFFSLSRYFYSKIGTHNNYYKLMYACEDDYQNIYKRISSNIQYKLIDGLNINDISKLIEKIK